MYAWTTIHTTDSDGKAKTIKPGESVDKGDFDEDEFDLLVNEGVIRDEKYPKDLRPGEAPNTYRFRKANEALLAAEAASRGESAPNAKEQADAANTVNNPQGSAADAQSGRLPWQKENQ